MKTKIVLAVLLALSLFEAGYSRFRFNRQRTILSVNLVQSQELIQALADIGRGCSRDEQVRAKILEAVAAAESSANDALAYSRSYR